ncbi:MAG: calcium-binding protein [Methyloceanibacter sp.]|uniref:calcium-binding protein n=1 Tax=Methyloceanibacter sp. TaxID=1965321 RepID=UPI003D6CF822
MPIVLTTQNESSTNNAHFVEPNIVVFANSSNNALTNNGVLWTTAAGERAVYFNSATSNATITNNSTGYIRGGTSGVTFEGNGATINNAGEIIGDQVGLEVVTSPSSVVNVTNLFGGTIKSGQVGIEFFAAGTSQINNDGIVFGSNTGIDLRAGTLTNSGEVGGGIFGIVCDGGDATIVNTNFGGIFSSGTAIAVSGAKATITNNADCLITGAQAAIKTDVAAPDSRISLTNHGKIDGDINCAAATGNVNDAILNKGIINGDVFLGFGNDLFNGAGGTSGKVFGFDGNDTLIGGSGNDVLDGGAGMDTIRGGLGKDQLYGGADRDFFDFDSIKDSVKGGKRDVIHDFERGTDDIDLRTIDAKTGGGNQAFKFIGKQDFHDRKGELRYEDKGNKVIVQGDVNGDGKADFEILVKVGALSAGDFLL